MTPSDQALTHQALVDVEDVRAEVDGHLATHLAELRTELGAHGSDVDPLLGAVEQILRGGKRLRAAFCYWSWRAHGGADRPTAAGRHQVLRVGAALELFQAAALFHDDVMDDSDLRRGLPAAHRAFAGLHEARGWTGSAAQFGESAAILLGDLALIASEREFTLAVQDAPGAAAVAARAVFDRMRTEVTVGQYLDVLAQALPWGTDPEADEQRARQVIRAKSARYSVEHPVTLGAVLAGADEDATGRCQEVGLPLGEAFQLRDDLLGVFGDPRATGKPAGDDLREGKRTVLVARALRLGTAEDRSILLTHLGRRDLSTTEVEQLRAVLTRTGAVPAVESLVDELAEPAIRALETSSLAEPGRSMLVALGRAAVDRQA